MTVSKQFEAPLLDITTLINEFENLETANEQMTLFNQSGVSQNESMISLESEPPQNSIEAAPILIEGKPTQARIAKANFRYSEDYNLYPNGAKTKYKNNIEAIKLLKKIESEKGLANTEVQIILARYVGWGGIANAFSDTAS